jgi:hypothetical protein
MTKIFIFAIIIGVFGFVLYATGSLTNEKTTFFEGFSGAPRCPDMLIQEGSRFYLFNSKLAKIPGVNPIEFNNLEEYTEFLEWQRSQGIRCPVLYLQKSFDAQGKSVFKVRPSVSDPQGGLPPSSSATTIKADGIEVPDYNPAFMDDYLNKPESLLVDATRNDKPFNQNQYPSFDESAYYQGLTTPLDEMDKEFLKPGAISPIATHPTWGGSKYTQSLVDKGYFKDNEVVRKVA